jgi:hypothetical protein
MFQSSVRGGDFTVVGSPKMRGEHSEQRRKRADGAIRSAVDRCAMGEDPALAPETKDTPHVVQPPADDRKVLEATLWIP